MSPSLQATPGQESSHRFGITVTSRALVWKARLRIFVILGLVGMTAYLLSVLIGLPIDIGLGRLISNPQDLSTTGKVLLAALALDLSKLIVLAVMAFPLGRLLAIRAWTAALGVTLSCYAFDAALAWVLQDFSQTWASLYALAGRLPLAMGTGFVVFWIADRAARPGKRTKTRKTEKPMQPGKVTQEDEPAQTQKVVQEEEPRQNAPSGQDAEAPSQPRQPVQGNRDER